MIPITKIPNWQIIYLVMSLKWFHNLNSFIYIKFLVYLLWSISCKLFSECLSDFITLTKIFLKGQQKCNSRETHIYLLYGKKYLRSQYFY